jgi:hypothetical protein
MPENDEQPNPYQQGRDHEAPIPMDREDVLAVAGLLGTVNGALGEIDKRNVGGVNPFVQARKMDPKQALKNIASANGAVIDQPNTTPSQHTPQQAMIPQQAIPTYPVMVSPPAPIPVAEAPVIQNNDYTAELEKRVRALESVVESYKKIEKFKRGIGYSISTAKIKGEFKDPITILDIISTEISKNTKTITLKLLDATTESKKQE